mmetsp:Transcript_106663/g.296854  ORF Transcript_106663/g.296854 Transcript_106663/m.296854 type:complete len:407 (-) Transcript_106663:97-1317(-)
MASAAGPDDIGQDCNFQRLAACKTGAEEFKSLLAEHVAGYTQRKRLLEGLKELIPRVEAVDTKVQISKQLGKAKAAKLELAERTLHESFGVADLKEKVQILNASLQASLDEGLLTAEEKAQVVEELAARLTAAEADGKGKLKEKLERMCTTVSQAVPITLPVDDDVELDALKKKLRALQQLEKKLWDSLGEHERKRLEEKPQLKEDIAVMEGKSRMWFETDKEFRQRLDEALSSVALLRLEQRRLEKKDAPAPENPPPQAKKKERRHFLRMDPYEIFAPQEPEEGSGEQADEAVQGRAQEEQEQEDAATPPEPPQPASPPPAQAAVDGPGPPWVQQEPAEGSDEAAPAPAASRPVQEQPEEEEGREFPLPTSTVKEAPAQKASPPQPKKKEKKRFTKLDVSSLGFA